MWWTLAGLTLVEWSIRIYSSVTTFPLVTVLVVLTGLWGLLTVGTSWLPHAQQSRFHTWRTVWSWGTALLVVGTFCLWAVLQIHQSPGYGTDELAFDQYAATLTQHGINPYVHSMAPSFNLYRVPPDGFTYTLTGHPITSLSYPDLSFLFYVPFLAFGWSTQMAVGVNVIAWGVSILLLFALLPRKFRAAALVLGSLSTYVAYSVGGVTDTLYVPFLLGAAYFWNRFPIETGWRRWRGPLLLGVAMAIKQTPWLLLPFLTAGIALEARSRFGTKRGLRVASTYAGVAVGTFLLANLPYLIVSPRSWLHSVLVPFTDHAVPTGQGAVGLSVFLRLGGGSLTAYTLLTLVALVGLLAVFIATYPTLRPLAFLVPSVVLFFAARSFGSYLVWLVPVGLLAAVTSQDMPATDPAFTIDPDQNELQTPEPWHRWPFVIAGVSLFGVATLAFALLSRPPLTVKIVGLRTTGQLATVAQLRVDVTNTSGNRVQPAFTVDEGGSFTTFWPSSGGPRTLAAGQTGSYTIRAPNFFSQAPIGGGFEVVAFTSSPAAVSTSSSYEPATLHVGLTPDAINVPVRIGQPVIVRAQLYDQFDRPVSTPNIPIYLGQIIYDQRGLILSQATVNGRPPGQTPVTAFTNDRGVATFTIVGTQASADPVSFEANLVSSSEFYPFGYSEILPIQFVRP